MRDLQLDDDGDLSVSDGRLPLTTADEGGNVAQRLQIRLRLLRREYVLDELVGMPYLELFGRKGTARQRLEATLRRAVSTCPGVASVEAFALTLDAERHAVLDPLRVQTTDGDVIDLAPFIPGDF